MHRLNIEHMVLGYVATNVYIVSNTETKECVIIDPAANPSEILKRIEKDGLNTKAILLTHGHFDHILAVNDIAEITGAPVYAHADEKKVLADPGVGLLLRDVADKAVTDFLPVKDGDILDLIGFKWKVIHTPGHSAGSVCYYIESEKVMFTGDTVFRGSYGRTDLFTGSFDDIARSIKEKIFTIPEDDTDLLPGHGEFTDLGYEKRHNEILMDT
ncbi:MAG: MBL fold metallo-hydrolase [Lachnospiraceae bacterium]|nr:MBL fold metallo-hydrolase [Lachnospiraceae bacterium]